MTADNFIALPPAAHDDLMPGTLVRIRREGDFYTIRRASADDEAQPPESYPAPESEGEWPA